jgi:hypothetical protein
MQPAPAAGETELCARHVLTVAVFAPAAVDLAQSRFHK